MTTPRMTLGPAARAMAASLTARPGEVPWADSATILLQDIQILYERIRGGAGEMPDSDRDLLLQLNTLETYITVDLQRHVALGNGRVPLYLGNLRAQLSRAQEVAEGAVVRGRFVDTSEVTTELDQVSAEIQIACWEFGFCDNVKTIFDVDEATQHLKALTNKLDHVDKCVAAHDVSNALIGLHDVIAHRSGIQQAMTENNVHRVQKQFNLVNERVVRLEQEVSSNFTDPNCELLMRYLAAQSLLKRSWFERLYSADSSHVISSHRLHPGTRRWLLNRIQTWLHKSEQRFFYLAGKEGYGKTALASALCKLHNNDVIASHFFDRAEEFSSKRNTVCGMIQSIACDIARTVPEYLNYLDDHLSEQLARNGTGRGSLFNSWETCYDLLIKKPLQDLRGAGPGPDGSSKHRKFILIDEADACLAKEWDALRSFLKKFHADISASVCILLTVRSDSTAHFVNVDDLAVSGVCLEDRAWSGRHIQDVETYVCASMGAVLSREEAGSGAPRRAPADTGALQAASDQLLKASAGRFDYAVELMEGFAAAMGDNGQFHSSLKRALAPLQRRHGDAFDQHVTGFASPYRAYRDKEGRCVDIRVMRQSHYLKDKTRAALIPGRQHAH